MQMTATADGDHEQPAIEAIQRGDQRAFRELLRRQDRWVRGIIFAVLGDADHVDDVAQQVWVAVWERVSELRDVRRWKAWLYRLARNAALDAGRQTKRNRRFVHRLMEQPPTPERPDSPVDTLLGSEKHQAVLRAIQSLPAIYREPFALRHLQGWSYQQIAGLLALPVDTVETRLVRARRQLREHLEGTLEL